MPSPFPVSSFCPEHRAMCGGVVSERSFTPGPSRDRVKLLRLDPCSLGLPRASSGRAHPRPATPAARLAELFPKLCFLSCSQYILPRTCLASFFLPRSLNGAQGSLPSPRLWPGRWGGTAQLLCVNVWCVSGAACICCVSGSAMGTDVCWLGSEDCPLSSLGTRVLCKSHIMGFLLRSLAKNSVEHGEHSQPLMVTFVLSSLKAEFKCL